MGKEVRIINFATFANQRQFQPFIFAKGLFKKAGGYFF